jgi:hypothetical protein
MSVALAERTSSVVICPFPRVDKPKTFVGIHEIEGLDEGKWLEYKLAKAASFANRLAERKQIFQSESNAPKFANNTSNIARATSFWGFGRNFNRY